MNEDEIKSLKIEVKLPKDFRLHIRFNKKLLEKFTLSCKALGKNRTEVIEELVKIFLKQE